MGLLAITDHTGRLCSNGLLHQAGDMKRVRLSQKNIEKDCHILVFITEYFIKYIVQVLTTSRFGGVVPSWLVHWLPGQTVRADLIPGRGHCVVFLDKTLNCGSVFLYQGG